MIVTWLNHRISGYLFVEMTGFSPERFFNMCSVHEIEIWGVSDTGRSCRFYMTVKGKEDKTHCPEIEGQT